MDQVNLTRAQLRKLADKQLDYTITATNEDAGLIFVEPTRKRGEDKGVWLRSDGRPRDEGVKL